MRLLVLIPNWPSASELWLDRMIDLLEPRTAVIATVATAERSWRGRIPVVSFGPPWSRAAGALGLTVPAARFGMRRLERLLSERRITHVLCHYLTLATALAPLWRRTAVPLVVHCHGYDVTWGLRSTGALPVPLLGPGYRGAVRALADRALLVANSRFTARGLEAIGVPANRIALKYYGVPAPDRPLRRERSEGLRILFLGRLVDFKGPELVLRAFDRAAALGLAGTLTVAGSGPLAERCARARRESPHAERIRLLGAVDPESGERLRRESDLFAAHNRRGPRSRQSEAFGVSLVEAMGAALPVVSGRSGGVPEIVEEGVTGLLVEPGDVEAQARAFLELERDPERRLRMGEAGWRRCRECFTPEQEQARLLEILEASETHASSRGA